MNLIAVLRVMLAFRIVRGLDSNMLHNGYSGPGSVKYLQEPLVKITDATGPARKLVEFTKSEYLTKEVVEVTQDVYVAIGYALANSIMVVAEKGIIIIDTTENAEAMEEILEEFRKITIKPVVAIVYTHFHGDHNAGTQSVIAEGKSRYPTIPIDIYAHQMTKDTMLDQIYTSDITHIRGVRQFGTSLDKIENWRTGSGLGPELRFFQADEKSIQILPTVTFTGERQTYLVTGIKFELIHTPGETDDQITVWLPDHDVALPGDNIYKTFPNLYAIRGTPARDPLKWYRSLDVVRSLHASHLVGSHTQPVSGKEAVYDTLLAYRDGIKYVHDQTLRYINKGLFPGEIVERVKLPEKLSNHPNLQEHYGTVEWSVKGVFANYLGWFSGNPTDLHHVSSAERAIRMLKLITNAQGRDECAVEILLREAENSHRSSFYQYQATGQHNKADNKWALELVDL